MTEPLAYRATLGAGPTIVFLPGYASDMAGTKALALEAWAQAQGRGFVRFDYRGCGESPGNFEDQSLAGWRDDVLWILDHVAHGRAVLVGSSMGGWLMLLVALARRDRIAGLVGVAAAPDFTGWGFTPEEKAVLRRHGRLERANPYGDQPTIYTGALWESGEANRVMTAPIDLDCRVRLLHGMRDSDVPWEHSATLARLLRSDDVQVTLIKDGDHRLSRDADIAQLIRAVEESCA